ncbi:class I SAM-dependent DNA methyltransferase [Pontibacter ruber]|uniref:Class I SAM-dependent DNA methyltransferase n=1 Tax=Pontibacter ruber TaxID=1343895 RepID=A0ABW5D190_9BACT|nr:class I SAM-dependent methyltransferase [Pontibacter ruber]
MHEVLNIMDSYKITIETWDKLAAAYQDKFMDLDLYNDTYDLFCQLIQKPNARIFEIGCGPGNITRYILAKRPDFQVEATDAAPNMVELARENNPAAKFSVMDCRGIDKIHDRFDGVMCGFCMPYLSREDCVKLIRDTAGILNRGGIFYFSTIEGDYNQSGYETSSSGENRMYVYYHQQDYLQQALKDNGFELVNLVRKGYEKADGTSATHLIFLAKKR